VAAVAGLLLARLAADDRVAAGERVVHEVDRGAEVERQRRGPTARKPRERDRHLKVGVASDSRASGMPS
jgi:hypothetical protein